MILVLERFELVQRPVYLLQTVRAGGAKIPAAGYRGNLLQHFFIQRDTGWDVLRAVGSAQRLEIAADTNGVNRQSLLCRRCSRGCGTAASCPGATSA